MGFNSLKAAEPIRENSLLFTIQFPGFNEFLVLNWSTSDGWKAELTLELPSGFVPGIPVLGIQRLLLQWNLSKADTYGIEVFVRLRKVSALERFELKSSQI